eukprot:3054608-Prymnesium_polylepis.2
MACNCPNMACNCPNMACNYPNMACNYPNMAWGMTWWTSTLATRGSRGVWKRLRQWGGELTRVRA